MTPASPIYAEPASLVQVEYFSASADYPIAIGRLEAGRGYWRWIVAVCPIPGCIFGSHIHGGGLLSENPVRLLSHRSHLSGGGGYELVDGFPEHTAALIAKHQGLVCGGACV
jgi:hypothetical protein